MPILENVQVNISRDSPWITVSLDGGEVTAVSSGSATSTGDANPPTPPNGWAVYNLMFRYKLSATGDWKSVVHKLFSGDASSHTGSLDVCLFRELDEIMWEYGDAEIPFQVWRAEGLLTSDWVLAASGTMRWDNSRQDYPTHKLIADNDSWWLRVKLTDADHPYLTKGVEATLADRPLIIGDQDQFSTDAVFHARIKRAAGTTSSAFSNTAYLAHYFPDSGVVNVPIPRWFGGSPTVGDAIHFLLESSGPTKDFVIAGGSVTFVKSLSRENDGTFCEHDEYFSIKLANDEGGVSPATVLSQELSPSPAYGVTEERFLGMYDFQCQWLARIEGGDDGPWVSIPTNAVQYIPTIGGLDVFLFDYLRVGAIAGDKWNFRVKQIATSGFVESISLQSQGNGYTTSPAVSFVAPSGKGATATANVEDGKVVSLSLGSGGGGYDAGASVAFTGGGGSGASAYAEVAYSYILEGVLEYDPDCVPPDTTNPTTTLFDVTAKRSTQRLRFRVRNYSPDPANAEITSAVAGASPESVAGLTGVFVFRYRIDDSPVWKDWEAHFDSETGVLDVSVGELISQAVDSIEYRIVTGASS